MDLLDNPFNILNATCRDDRRRIVELSEERKLQIDPAECDRARSDLTNPRKRLSAEIAWLPGIGPRSASESVAAIENSVVDPHRLDGLPPITKANMLAAAILRVSDTAAEEIAEWILHLANSFEEIDAEELHALINEERVVSGFPQVTDLSAVEAEIQERRNHYRHVIATVFGRFTTIHMAEIVTIAVDSATDDGTSHAPVLIDDLVDIYEVKVHSFLEEKREQIEEIVGEVRSAADDNQSDAILTRLVNKLIEVVEYWDFVAQPIQVSSNNRGLNHDASHEVAGLLRELAVCLYNEHGKLGLARQIINALQKVFAEVGELAELTTEDASTLDEIAAQRQLTSIQEMCASALHDAQEDPASAHRRAEHIISSASLVLSKLSASDVAANLVSQTKDYVAITLMACAVEFGNKTEEWNHCVSILTRALDYAVSQEVKDKIQNNLHAANKHRLASALARHRKSSSAEVQRIAGGVIAVIVVVIVGIACLSSFNDNGSSSSTRDSETSPISSRMPTYVPSRQEPEYPSQPLPYNGQVRSHTHGELIAPLEIRASAGSHYLVKLVDRYRNMPVMTIFVRSGMTASVDVPLGNYEIRYAAGDTWYGNEHLFGPNTVYSKAEASFDFRIVGNQISGYSVTLYRVVDGNLQTSQIVGVHEI